MRYVAIVIWLISVPMLISLLRQMPHLRKWAFLVMGALLLFAGWHFEAAIIGWPLWTGVVRGLEIAPIDAIALALIVTRRQSYGLPPLWGFLAFYGAALFLSLVISQVPMATAFVVWQYLRIIVLFAAIAGEGDRPDMRQALLNGLSLGLLMQLFYVVQQKASGMVQAVGTTIHQNTLGMM